MENKIQKLEEDILDIKEVIKTLKNSKDEKYTELEEIVVQENPKSKLLKVEPEKQTVYCQCCNFTNSNHNAARLLFEIILIVLNLSSVCGLCYVIFVK